MNKNQRKRPSTTRFIPIKEEVRKVKIMLSFVHSIFMMQTWLIEERSSKVFLLWAFPQLQLEERHHQQWLLRQCLHHVVRPFLILRLDSPGTKIPANISFFTVHKEKAPSSDLWWYNPKKSPLHLSEHKNIWIYSTEESILQEETLYPRLYCPADYHQVGPSCYAISFFRALGMRT